MLQKHWSCSEVGSCCLLTEKCKAPVFVSFSKCDYWKHVGKRAIPYLQNQTISLHWLDLNVYWESCGISIQNLQGRTNKINQIWVTLSVHGLEKDCGGKQIRGRQKFKWFTCSQSPWKEQFRGQEEMEITFSTLKENLLKPWRQEQKQRKQKKTKENSPEELWKSNLSHQPLENG